MRLVPLVLAAIGLAFPVSGQCSPCQTAFDDATFLDSNSMGGPNLLLAIKATAASALAVQRIEVFTGEQTGSNTVAIWSHDAAGNRPSAPLGGGSFLMSRNNGWQGANLTQTVNLTAGATFWLVWGPQNGAQSSIRARGGNQEYRGSFDGGASWNGPYTGDEWKFRIYCCQRDVGSYLPFGSGCPGSSRKIPAIGNVGVPTLNQSFQVTLSAAPPLNSVTFVLGGSDQSWLGLTLPFDLAVIGAAGCDILVSQDIVLPQTADLAGNASRTLAVPNDMTLLGVAFFDQWIISDPGANPLNLTTSNGGKGTVGKD